MIRIILIIAVFIIIGCSRDHQGNVAQRSNKNEDSVATSSSAQELDSASSIRTSRQDIVKARRKYEILVLRFDASKRFGTNFPYSDYVRLKITNNSELTLKYLTVLTKRFDANGKMIGSSRAPSIPAGDIRPGDTGEVDYYPKGHLSGVRKITLEVEDIIAPEVEQFFPELRGL